VGTGADGRATYGAVGKIVTCVAQGADRDSAQHVCKYKKAREVVPVVRPGWLEKTW
jgi:hypothetical protein